MDAGADDLSLLVKVDGERWREPDQVGYVSEDDLQQMLADQPSLVPGVGQRAVAAREFHTGVGPSDVLIVDQNGTITVIECKLASNAEVRRKIIGQVLDDASRLWRMPLADFESRSEEVTVLAVELRRVSHGGVHIPSPRSFGQESARSKQAAAGTGKRDAWTVDDVRAQLVHLDPSLSATFAGS